MSDNTISIDVQLAIAQAQKDIAALQSQFTVFGVNLTKVMGGADKSMDVFKGTLAALLAEKALEYLKEAAVKLFEVFITDGIEAASEFGAAVTELNTSLALAGQYSERTSNELVDYARSLSDVSTASVTTIVKSMSLIEALGDLDEKGLKRATKDALDLSAAMAGKGLSVETASNLLAKAAAGSTAGLVRYGIVIDQNGTAAERYARTLALVEQKFGGAAQAQIQSYAGALTQAKNEFEELQIATGSAITQNPLVIEGLHIITEAFKSMTDWVRSNQDTIQTWVTNGILFGISGLKALLVVLNFAVEGFRVWGNELLIANDLLHFRFRKAVDDAKDGIHALTAAWTGKGGALQGVIDYVDGASNELVKHSGDVIAAGGHIQNVAQRNSQVEVEWTLKSHNTILDTILGRTKLKELEFNADKTHADLLKNLNLHAGASDIEIAKRVSEYKRTLNAKDAAETKKLINEEAQAYNQLQQTRLQMATETLTTIATLTTSKNKEMFYVGKAASLALAIINTATGVTKAYEQGGAYGFITAAAVLAAGLVQIENIESQNPSFAGGGIVPGNSFSGDRKQANVNSGEMIINSQQQAGLFDFIKNGSPGKQGDTYVFHDTVVDSPARIDQLINRLNSRVRSGTPMLASRVVA